MSDRGSNDGWKFGLGLIAGAILGYWLNSEQGKRVRQETSEQLTDYGHQVSEYSKEKATHIQSNLNTAIDKGQKLLEDLSTYAKDTISNTADKAENALEKAENSFKKGLDKAKKKVS